MAPAGCQSDLCFEALANRWGQQGRAYDSSRRVLGSASNSSKPKLRGRTTRSWTSFLKARRGSVNDRYSSITSLRTQGRGRAIGSGFAARLMLFLLATGNWPPGAIELRNRVDSRGGKSLSIFISNFSVFTFLSRRLRRRCLQSLQSIRLRRTDRP